MPSVLVVIGCLVSLTQVHWHTFLDESENVYYGYRMSRGAALYGEMFSHHFPFPYWWTAGTILLAGKSITALRVSLVVFQAVAFVAALRLTAAPLAVGSAAVVWSCVGYLYYGNLLILYTFKALSLMVVAAVALLGPGRQSRYGPRMACVGIYCSVAVLTDPTCIYFVALTAVVVARTRGRGALMCMLLPGLMAAVGAALWLYWAGVWGPFVASAYEFNRDVYATYGRSTGSALRSMLPYDGVARQALSGLKMMDGRWWHLWPDTGLQWPGALHDRWVLTGLAYRVYVVAFTLRLALSGDFIRAFGVYGFAALALALRGEEGFHSSTFALLGILFGSALFTSEGGAAGDAKTRPGLLISSLWAVPLVALTACGAVTIWQHRGSLGYEANFKKYEDLAQRIDEWACHDPDVRVSYWPSDLLVNWYTERLPLSKYTYVLPWTLATSRDEIVAALEERIAVIVVDLQGSIGPWKNADYLDEMLAILRASHVSPETGVYVSRQLSPCVHGGV